jgi:hypothetical protein
LYKISPERQLVLMTWISTVAFGSTDEKLRKAFEEQKHLYPVEYATPVHAADGGGSQIVASHSLIPEALYHAFATFGVTDVAGLAAIAAATRDDRNSGVGHQSVCLLN